MSSAGLSWREGLRYGLLGLPLAFCALPLYMLMPNLYAREWGIPLGALGALLLATRLLDALVDPWLGRWSDRLFGRSRRAVLGFGAAAAALLALSFGLLFLPQVRGATALLVWAGACLLGTYLAYSALMVAHQSWGARLGGGEGQQGHIVAWREGLGLLGVLLAAATPALLGESALVALLVGGLALGFWAWTRAPYPAAPAHSQWRATDAWRPWRQAAFRRLLLVYLLNGIASAIPATLVLFFVQDRLQGDAAWQSASLGLYFVCAAISMPLWLRLVGRLGLRRSWLLGMLLSIAAFLGAAQLGAGDMPAFLLVCALSGMALGSDLTSPSALLAGVIHAAGERGRSEGSYFGWWNFASKLNLALAAGLTLPLLAWLGYQPGTRDPEALQMLSLAYCLLPCLLKALAALALRFSFTSNV